MGFKHEASNGKTFPAEKVQTQIGSVFGGLSIPKILVLSECLSVVESSVVKIILPNYLPVTQMTSNISLASLLISKGIIFARN